MRRAAAAAALCAALLVPAVRGVHGQPRGLDFDEDRAWAHLVTYMGLSPILPGSDASRSLALYVRTHLEALGYAVSFDEWSGPEAPVPLRNLVARRGSGPRVRLVGAHYDTRLRADKDPDPARRGDPVPGANDGGSGFAVLLELARAVSVPPGTELRLALFDAEDQGGIQGWGGRHGGWILGSERMASRLTAGELDAIAEVIVVDLVGDRDLLLRREALSEPRIADQIWQIAAQMGYADTFAEGDGGAVTDDHVPFRERGLPVVDLIQLQARDGSAFFRWHHTTHDTLEHVSRVSLGRVGRTLEAYLEQPPPVVRRAPTGPGTSGGGRGWTVLLVAAAAVATAGLSAARWRRARRAKARPRAAAGRRSRQRR